MAQGLRVYDEQGRLTLDMTDRVSKILGSVRVAGSGTAWAPLLQGNQLWAVFVPDDTYIIPPAITISGNTVSWSAGESYSGLIYYGSF
ncbi:hypothetical protein [Iodobacter fluviatilis]|uniref:Uncharacterized protein n=1 Tax=Iodobacter fluviatilis TaxID=537 RepID=A0A7G3GAC2_9NEIS|nr:hypothetical protein [Iodobacter fluviatilis]QBC44470.1 hypothetical protein C1H71_13630 [Iodobacter fluviatilis]